MKKIISALATALCANLLLAAEPTPQEALVTALKNLAEKPNYSWKLTVEEPDRPTGTIDGKTEKEGATLLALARGDQSFEGVLKGSRGALKTDEGWKSLSELADDASQSGAIRFVARLLQNFKAPAAEVADLAPKIKDLKLVDGAYAGTLSKDTAKELFFFRTQRDGNGPELTDAKGSIKFWVKDGLVSRYEYSIDATFSADGNDRQIKRTHSLDIKDVGATKVAIPDEAAKKL